MTGRRRLSVRPFAVLAVAVSSCGGGGGDGSDASADTGDSVAANRASARDSTPPLAGPVTIQGRVVDARTGAGIGGAVVIVLRPGVTSRQWQEARGTDGADDGMQSAAIADSAGAYEILGLQRGRSYTVMVTAERHDPAIFEGGLEITPTDPPVTRMQSVSLEPTGT